MNGLSDQKLESSDFVNILVKNDIIFLFESWTGPKSHVDLSGYVCHNFYRTFQHRHARRRSDGVVLYYRESLKDGIKIVKSYHNSVIWIKLDQLYFGTSNDIYICGIYLWPDGSPAYIVVNVDFFELLENDISFYKNQGDVYLCGDFNSRVGLKHDFIMNDNINDFIDTLDYIPDSYCCRASLDTKSNSFGSKLLDLCKSTCMRIANGRVGNDQGHFTFVSQNGASVVDYLLSMECSFKHISCFMVNSMNEFSDHAALSYSLRCKNSCTNVNDEYYSKYKWSQLHRDAFRSDLICKLPLLNQLVSHIESTETSINKTVLDFSNIVKDTADKYFLNLINKAIVMYLKIQTISMTQSGSTVSVYMQKIDTVNHYAFLTTVTRMKTELIIVIVNSHTNR